MRYGFLSTAAVAALALSVAAGVAQTSGSGGAPVPPSTGAPAAGGGAAGGTAGGGATTAQPRPPSAGSTAQPSPQQGAAPATGGAATTQSGTASGTATGAAGAATGSVPTTLTTEQRTQITRSFSSVNVTPLPSVNFSLSIGTAVPETVVLHDVPAEVVTVVPAYRRYKYFVVGNRIVIVDNNRRIVTIIERSA